MLSCSTHRENMKSQRNNTKCVVHIPYYCKRLVNFIIGIFMQISRARRWCCKSNSSQFGSSSTCDTTSDTIAMSPSYKYPTDPEKYELVNRWGKTFNIKHFIQLFRIKYNVIKYLEILSSHLCFLYE